MSPTRVLIVDREPHWREFAYQALTSAGYMVEVQPNSKFRRRPETKFDLVLIDASEVAPGTFRKLATVVEKGSDGRPNIVILTPVPVSVSQASALLKLRPREVINTPFSSRDLTEQLRRILEVDRHGSAVP
jgi:DNA-binding NtrC family response regulator